jgi:hypothetical protein
MGKMSGNGALVKGDRGVQIFLYAF